MPHIVRKLYQKYELPWLFDCVCQYQPNYSSQTYKITTLYKHVNGFEMHYTHILYFSLRKRVRVHIRFAASWTRFFVFPRFNSYSLHIFFFSIGSSHFFRFYLFETHTFDGTHSFIRFLDFPYSIYERIYSTFQWITTVYSSPRHRAFIAVVVVVVVSSTYNTIQRYTRTTTNIPIKLTLTFHCKPSNK